MLFTCYPKSLTFFFSSRRRHTISTRDWSSDVCSSDLVLGERQPGSIRDLPARRRDIENVCARQLLRLKRRDNCFLVCDRSRTRCRCKLRSLCRRNWPDKRETAKRK